jgi:membrane-bound ClpP family serine protease
MEVGQVYMLIVAGLLLWLITSFHWLRILGGGFIMFVWGAAVVIAPLYLAWDALTHRRVVQGILTIAVSAITAGIWMFAAKSAREWWIRQDKYGQLWLPWNAR